MATVEIAILSTTEQNLPAGEAFGTYVYQILAADGTTMVQTGSAPTLSFTFPVPVAPGAYVASAQAQSTTGVMLGTAVTSPFTVVAPAQFAAPATVTVTLS